MKKTRIIAAGAVVAVMLSLGSTICLADKSIDLMYSTNAAAVANSNYMDVESVKDLAVQDAGGGDAVFSKIKLKYDDGFMVYKMKFTLNGMKFEYEIEATNGTILEKKTKTQKVKASDLLLQDQSSYIGLENAKAKALEAAGVADGVFTEAKLDCEKGTVVYELEFYSNSTKYEYDIDATTGAIVDYEMKYSNKAQYILQ